jgi:hypothetical protein
MILSASPLSGERSDLIERPGVMEADPGTVVVLGSSPSTEI